MPRSSQNPVSPPPGHVWSDEASRLTGLSVKTLWNYRHLGKGPKPFPIGRKLAYPLDEINAWLDAQRNPATDTDEAHSSRPPEPRRLRASRSHQHAAAA